VDLGPDELRAEWWYVDRDEGGPTFGAGLVATRVAPMRLDEVDEPLPDPEPTLPPPVATPPTDPAAGSDDGSHGSSDGDGLPLGSIGGAALLAAVVGALVAIRHRTSRPDRR
jgi:hypothetical protein